MCTKCNKPRKKCNKCAKKTKSEFSGYTEDNKFFMNQYFAKQKPGKVRGTKMQYVEGDDKVTMTKYGNRRKTKTKKISFAKAQRKSNRLSNRYK